MIILAIDGLEYDLTEEFSLQNLKQEHYGKTDISEFEAPRTIILWSSFLTGENREKEILANGKDKMWNTKIEKEDSFLKHFNNPKVIDLPGYNYEQEQHAKERELLKAFFEAKSKEEKEDIRKDYNQHSFKHHRRIKEDYKEALGGGHDLLLCYFAAADVLAHLNWGNKSLMKIIYEDMDEMAKLARENSDKVLILSDHGMEGIGAFGDHSDHGFWSTNFKDLKNPKITEFGKIIERESK